MKLIKPSFEIYEQGPGVEGIYEAIERAGRTCYKSKRPEGKTAKDFVDRMIASQHYAMLEHGTVYLKIPHEEAYSGFGDNWVHENYSTNPYSIVNSDNNGDFFVTTNYRVLVENGWLDDLKYLCKPTECHEKRISVRFICDRGVSHEFVRHRVFSFAQESTRYCNYSKDKFGNELTFIVPSTLFHEEVEVKSIEEWYTKYLDPKGKTPHITSRIFLEDLLGAEKHYLELIKYGCTPQQARQILPNALKTELVMTGFVSDWKAFFSLRAKGTTGAPHPDAKALAEPLMGNFYKRNWL